MSTFHGPPSSFDGDPYTFIEYKKYHWGLVYHPDQNRKAEMIWNRATLPLNKHYRADMVIRYDPDTWEATVVKFRYGESPLSLEEAEHILLQHEEAERRDLEIAKQSFVMTELGLYLHSQNED